MVKPPLERCLEQVSLLEEPIRHTLLSYQEAAEGRLTFDINRAAKLERKLRKPNFARSVTNVLNMGKEVVGELFVIAFRPYDGTGMESDIIQFSKLSIPNPYPRSRSVVPRSKDGIASEVHLALVTQTLDEPQAEPKLFQGKYDLLGLSSDKRRIEKIGQLGPYATLTVGSHGNASGFNERFGDPHAVFNGEAGALQICAFLAVTNAINASNPDLLSGFNAQLPDQVAPRRNTY